MLPLHTVGQQSQAAVTNYPSSLRLLRKISVIKKQAVLAGVIKPKVSLILFKKDINIQMSPIIKKNFFYFKLKTTFNSDIFNIRKICCVAKLKIKKLNK